MVLLAGGCIRRVFFDSSPLSGYSKAGYARFSSEKRRSIWSAHRRMSAFLGNSDIIFCGKKRIKNGYFSVDKRMNMIYSLSIRMSCDAGADIENSVMWDMLYILRGGFE